MTAGLRSVAMMHLSTFSIKLSVLHLFISGCIETVTRNRFEYFKIENAHWS